MDLPGTKEKYGPLWHIPLMCPASESAVVTPHVNIHGMIGQCVNQTHWEQLCSENRREKNEMYVQLPQKLFKIVNTKIIFFKHKVSGNLLGIYFQIVF